MSTLDRNKGPLTHAITQRVALWMDERGFKPVETEVWLGDRWVADLAGVITPTQTELSDLKLIKRRPRFAAQYGPGRGEEYVADVREWEATVAAIPPILTCAVEVKVSRSDFAGDWKWQAPAQTDLRYLAMPRGLVSEVEWPAGWGVLEMSADGSKVLKAHRPAVIAQTAEQRLKVVLSLAMRQFNTVRYARVREWQKEVNLTHAHERVAGRMQDAIGVVMDVVKGERTVEEALAYRRICTKLPDWTKRELEALRAQMAVPTEGATS